jgi:signal transduction histidine kinase/DNA-binding response OmpR family regulator
MAVQKYDIRRPAKEGGGFEERWWSPVNSPVFGSRGDLAYIIHRVEDVTDFIRIRQAGIEQQKLAAELQNRAATMESEIFLRAQQIQDANEKLRRANEEITRLYEKTKVLDGLKTQFFASVSHELRTPLTLVLGPLQRLLEAPAMSEAAHRDLEVIARNARTLLRHVDDLLDVSKLEAARMKPEYMETDIARLTRVAASHFEVLAHDKNITCTLDIPAELRAQVDPDMLRRILLNLLSNAFKFTPAGGRVRLALKQAAGRVIFEVGDSGPGIPRDQRAAIFERFRQLDGAATRRYGGTGLGLAIAHDFAALHAGTITVTDAAEGGALFVAEIPAAAPPGTEVRAMRTEAEGAEERYLLIEELQTRQMPPPVLAGPHEEALILVVEDNPEMNRFICEALAFDFRVAAAFDGKDGLEQAIRLGPDLVLSDIMMPDMSGDELVYALRSHRELDRTPIVILTARADEDLRIRLLREGAQDYVTKPFAVEELRARVRNLVNLKRSHEVERKLRQGLERVTNASMAISDALAALSETGLEVALKTIVLQAQTLTGAEYAALGIGDDPDRSFSPWVFSGVSDQQAAEIGAAPRPIGVLGIPAREGRVIRLHDLRQSGDFRGFPAYHPEMTSLLGVPIHYRGRSVGNIYLANKRAAEEFTDDDELVVRMLAARTGAAIESATLYDREALQRMWLQALFESMPEAVIVADEHGRALQQNHAARMLARDTGRVTPSGIPVTHDLRLPSGRPIAPEESPLERALVHGETVVGMELKLLAPDGRLVPILVSATPVNAERGTKGAIVVFQDISAMKEVERLREEWAAVIAHDLRQPVGIITLGAEILRTIPEDRLPEPASKAVERIRAASTLLTRMIGDLLDASQIEAQRLAIECRSVNLSELIERVVDSLREEAAGHGLRIDAGRALTAWVDPDRIQQVLGNLLSNAVKYSYPESEIRIEAANRDHMVEIVVTNRGPGIAPEQLPLLFNRFARTREARKGTTPGLGLGLYISSGLVEAHGGKLWAESAPGDTTSFHFMVRKTPPAPQSSGKGPRK